MSVQKQDGLHTDVGVSNADLRGKEFLFCKRNADGTIDLAGDGDKPCGVISEGKAQGYHTSFNLRGNPILKVKSAGQINRGDPVQCAANGLAKEGSVNSFGTARNSVVDGQYVEIEQI